MTVTAVEPLTLDLGVRWSDLDDIADRFGEREANVGRILPYTETRRLFAKALRGEMAFDADRPSRSWLIGGHVVISPRTSVA